MSSLKERNLKVIQKHLVENKEIKTLRETMMKRFGVDPITDEKLFPFKEGRVDMQALKVKLEEADSGSAFPQFLRAGLNQIVLGMYEATPTTWQEWVTAVATDKDTEIFAPNHGVAFPREVGRGEKYPEVGMAALDIELKMKKFGALHATEMEFSMDDKSGSLMQQQGLMGEYLAILKEVYIMGKLASVSGMKFQDLIIPVSETKPSSESSYPWSQAFVGGGANKPASYGALNQANIQAGIIALMNQKNLQGIKMLVNPDKLIIGPQYKFDAAVLMNSAFYPSGAAAAGSVGGAFSVNELKGLLDIVVSRYMFKQDGTVNGDSKAWYLVDSKRPFFVCCERTPVAVEVEAPNTGAHFEQDLYRAKAHTRFNADFLDPRFAWQGNDGSV
jgi:hypothetical protein